ncbi:MAG TPA: hypothetical protein VFE17_09010 [Candidatus Baltobacteraceae bacterium]|jgi:high-affinity nickel-transport protein|nr:hypothetical protein [Candidatus Baltobacteraceae bacterium]
MDRIFAAAYRSETRAKLLGIFVFLVALNAGAWIALIAASHRFPILLALGVTAYVLGLRHAVDPDHIAAIDSTTRKLMHEGERPVGVGLFFSLGHSTIVVVLSALVAVFGSVLKAHLPQLQSAGGFIGTSISALFLLIIAIANVAILIDLVREGGRKNEEDVFPGGVLARFLRPALLLVTRSSHMYLVGMLFGLGFDTATEIGLLGISAASGAGGMPVIYIMLLPLLFVAGMSLVDTTEGVAMLGAYSWAYVRPARKLIYNFNMTLFSIVISLVIGGIEALTLLGVSFGGALTFSSLGYGVLGVFGCSLAVSALITRVRSGAN